VRGRAQRRFQVATVDSRTQGYGRSAGVPLCTVVTSRTQDPRNEVLVITTEWQALGLSGGLRLQSYANSQMLIKSL